MCRAPTRKCIAPSIYWYKHSRFGSISSLNAIIMVFVLRALGTDPSANIECWMLEAYIYFKVAELTTRLWVLLKVTSPRGRPVIPDWHHIQCRFIALGGLRSCTWRNTSCSVWGVQAPHRTYFKILATWKITSQAVIGSVGDLQLSQIHSSRLREVSNIVACFCEDFVSCKRVQWEACDQDVK